MMFMDSRPTESLKTDLTTWEIGPYHGALPAPMRLKLKLDGEIIVSGEAETGFLHRGLEKAMEFHPWQSLIAYADRLDPESAVFGELVVCLAVEEIGNITVPPRAQAIRVILCELGRISAHMVYMARMARAAGAETMFHYVLRDREKVVDLFELLTGARFSHNFLRYGGVKEDVTEGFIERVLEVCELIRIRLKEYNDLFTFNQIFLKRAQGVGLLGEESVRHYGVTGPNARASGVSVDIRKLHPYLNYASVDFEVPIGKGEQNPPGDVHDRFLQRLREVSQSVDILRQTGETVLPGEFNQGKISKEFKVPSGEAYVRVESSRGMLGCHIASDGGVKPNRVQFRVPTQANFAVIPELIVGIRIEDLPVVLASLDLGIAEADR